MIQILKCPVCLTQLQRKQYEQHSSNCSKSQGNSSSSKKSIDKKSSQFVKIELEIDIIRMYCGVQTFFNILIKQCQHALQAQFKDNFVSFKLIINQLQSYINLIANQEPLLNSIYKVKQKIQLLINSFEIVLLKIDDTYLDCIYDLGDQYILHRTESEVLLIARKKQILQQTINFYSDLLLLYKTKRKFKLAAQVLQIDGQKQKQIEDALKYINILVANPDMITIKVKNMEKQNKILIFVSGLEESVNTCKQYLTQYLKNSSLFAVVKRYKISEQQFRIISKNKILQQYKQQIGIKYDFKHIQITRTVRFQQNQSSLHLICNSSIFYLPKSLMIVVPQNIMNTIEELQQSSNYLKDYMFISCQEQNILQFVRQLIKQSIDTEGEIGLLLPQTKKQQFLATLISIMQETYKKIKVYVLEKKDEKKAIEAIKSSIQMQKKWYVKQGRLRRYYPKKLNDQINQSVKNNITNLTATHKQLQLSNSTHTYNYENGQIIHKITGKIHLVEDLGEILTVFIGHQTYNFQKQLKSKQLTIGLVQINTRTKIQQNLITEQQYPIQYQMVKIQDGDQIYGQQTSTQIVVSYSDQEVVNTIINRIKVLLMKSKIIQEFNTQKMSKQKIKQIRKWCKINKIQLKIEEAKIIAYSYNQHAIQNLSKLIEISSKKILAGHLQYPDYWNQSQEQNLKLYDINQESQQFKKVQNTFKVGKIRHLQRIQNTTLFQKYNSQRAFLSEVNEAPIRQVLMYHGTRANQPELIYGDIEQSFNINYANMGSYGKGIYFAKNSQYSNNYCYVDKKTKYKQMFYCLVLAGHSQIYNGKQTLNTTFRIEDKKIRYQSVTSSKLQEILVVFKNRRAYPLYLISY